MILGLFNSARLNRSFNFYFVSKMMGVLFLIQVPFLIISILLSLYYKDSGLHALYVTTITMFGTGLFLYLIGYNANKYTAGRHEGMLCVSLSWFIVSLIGMLPFYLGDYHLTLSDAYFETISGYTTTGSTILNNIEALPRSILFWRSIIQWMGGIGIVVLVVAFIPLSGEKASLLYNSETTGITHTRFLPRIGHMAKWVVGIYVILSIICTLLLWAGPMGLYDAVCHTATCLATGGFSTKNDSIAAFNSLYVDMVLTIFMIFGSISLPLFYLSFKKKRMLILKDTEVKWFLGLIFFFYTITTLWLWAKGIKPTFFDALHSAVVQVTSLCSTTGYTIENYNAWGPFFGFIAIIGMFISGCAGSTSGGLKVIRFVITIKNLGNEFRKRTHPNAVLPVRINGQAIPSKVVHQVLAFCFSYLALVTISSMLVSMDGVSVGSAISASVACISNSGPAIDQLGPTANFFPLSAFSKIVLSIIMVIGRLEIFTVMTILHPSFWRK